MKPNRTVFGLITALSMTLSVIWLSPNRSFLSEAQTGGFAVCGAMDLGVYDFSRSRS